MSRVQNIVIVSAVYPPEPLISARMSFDLANYLANARCHVTVLCPLPSRPLTAIYGEYSNINIAVVKIENGVKVVRLPSFASPRARLFSRMWESFSFGREVTRYLAKEVEKPDVLYVNAWPLFAQIIIGWFAKKKAIPMVLQIMDIYPEALTSRLPSFWRFVIDAPLRKIDSLLAGAAATVVVISRNMQRTYVDNRQISIESVSTICTWQDEVIFENVTPRSECCSRYEIPVDPFTFLFLGNIGSVAGVDFLIRAFAEADIIDAQLLIVGDGSARLDCVKLTKQLNLSRVHFISDPDAANVPVLQSMAHVCLLPMKRGSGMSSIPSKLPSYLFSAKPVIATVDLASDTAHLVQQAECGWVGEPEDLSWLALKMKEVSKLPIEQLELIGQRGKRFGLGNFSKSSGVVQLANTVLQAAGVNL